MIYTSNFAKASYLDKNEYDLYSIALYKPKFVNYYYKTIPMLAPEKDLLSDYKKGIVTDEEYIKRYTEMIERKGFDKIRKFLIELENGNDKTVLLLCYCGKGKFCHRHILQSLFSDLIKGELN